MSDVAGVPIPSDKSTVAIIVLVLVGALRELWGWAKKKAEQDEAKKEGTVAKLEAKIDSLASDVRGTLRELTTAQANQHADLAVALQRITSLELSVAKLGDSLARKSG